MTWIFDNNKPIYTQLIEYIKLDIISGKIVLGSKLPAVRELAEEAGVNPNTMQKALVELEREELVFSKRTVGRFVTDDKTHIKKLRNDYAKNKIVTLVDTLLQLGYGTDEILELVNSYLKEG